MVVLSKKGTIRDGLAESGGDHDIGSLCGPAICGAECRADCDGFWADFQFSTEYKTTLYRRSEGDA